MQVGHSTHEVDASRREDHEELRWNVCLIESFNQFLCGPCHHELVQLLVRALLRVTQPVSESPDAVLFVVGDALGLALLIQVVVYVRKQFWNLSV